MVIKGEDSILISSCSLGVSVTESIQLTQTGLVGESPGFTEFREAG